MAARSAVTLKQLARLREVQTDGAWGAFRRASARRQKLAIVKGWIWPLEGLARRGLVQRSTRLAPNGVYLWELTDAGAKELAAAEGSS